MKIKTLTITPSVSDDDGISLSQKPAAGGRQNLTITGALAASSVATMDVPRHALITSSADDSGRTFTITGTDRRDVAMTETIVGPNTATIKGSKNFATVTQVNVDANTAGNIKVGTADELESQIIPMDHYNEHLSYAVKLSSGASLKYKFKYTYDNVFSTSFHEDTAKYFDDLGERTGDSESGLTFPITGCRLAVYGFSSGTITFEIVPARN